MAKVSGLLDRSQQAAVRRWARWALARQPVLREESPQLSEQSPQRVPLAWQRVGSPARRRCEAQESAPRPPTVPQRCRRTVLAQSARQSGGSWVLAAPRPAQVRPHRLLAQTVGDRGTRTATGGDHPCGTPPESPARATPAALGNDPPPVTRRLQCLMRCRVASTDWPMRALRALQAAAGDRARAARSACRRVRSLPSRRRVRAACSTGPTRTRRRARIQRRRS
jgi:hypothetical protein